VFALPGARQVQRRDQPEDLLILLAPPARLEVRGCDAGTAEELLDLIARQLGRAVEEAQELTREGLGRHGRRILDAARLLVEELVDANQRFEDRHRAAVVDEHLTVMARVVFERLPAADHLKVGFRQACLLVVFQHMFETAYVVEHLPTHLRPAHRGRVLGPLSADVDDVELNLLGTKRARLGAFALGLIAADRPRRFEIETRLEKALQYRDPWVVLAMVEREREYACQLQGAMCLFPTRC